MLVYTDVGLNSFPVQMESYKKGCCLLTHLVLAEVAPVSQIVQIISDLSVQQEQQNDCPVCHRCCLECPEANFLLAFQWDLMSHHIK